MENIESNLPNENSFNCSREITEYLLETSKWGKFLAILGYIGIGILVIIAFVIMVVFTFLNKTSVPGIPMGLIGLIYIALAAIYYFPVSYLYKYSVLTKQGLESGDSLSVSSGFRNLKSLFKFMGVLTIVIFSIYGVILLVALPFAYFFTNHWFIAEDKIVRYINSLISIKHVENGKSGRVVFFEQGCKNQAAEYKNMPVNIFRIDIVDWEQQYR